MASSSLLGGHMEINHWVTRRTMTVKRLDACLTRLSLPIKDCSPDPYISYTKKKIHVQCVIHITLPMWTNSIKNISTQSERAASPSTSTHSPPRKSNDSLRRWYWCTTETKSPITQTTFGGIYPWQRLWHIESRLRNNKGNNFTLWIKNIN